MKREKDTTENASALARKDTSIIVGDAGSIDEAALFERVAAIIENRRSA
jgi:hypothetical protein